MASTRSSAESRRRQVLRGVRRALLLEHPWRYRLLAVGWIAVWTAGAVGVVSVAWDVYRVLTWVATDKEQGR